MAWRRKSKFRFLGIALVFFSGMALNYAQCLHCNRTGLEEPLSVVILDWTGIIGLLSAMIIFGCLPFIREKHPRFTPKEWYEKAMRLAEREKQREDSGHD